MGRLNRPLRAGLRRLAERYRGATAVEYALLLGLIGMTVIVAVTRTGVEVTEILDTATGIFDTVTNRVDDSDDDTGGGDDGGTGGVYAFVYNSEFGGWDSTCSYDRQRTRTASCTLNGAPADFTACMDNLPHPGAGSVQVVPEGPNATLIDHGGAWFGGCELKWKYRYEGTYGRYGNTSTDPDNWVCWEGPQGTPVTRWNYPARCYMVAPNGSEFPPSYLTAQGVPGNGDSDDACVASGLPNPGNDVSARTLIPCSNYGGNLEGSFVSSNSACTGDLIASMPMPYGTDADVARNFCRSNGATCCSWVPDPAENAPDAHQRMWSIGAHHDDSSGPAAGPSGFAWWTYGDYDTPRPYDLEDVIP